MAPSGRMDATYVLMLALASPDLRRQLQNKNADFFFMQFDFLLISQTVRKNGQMTASPAISDSNSSYAELSKFLPTRKAFLRTDLLSEVPSMTYIEYRKNT